MRCSQAVLAHFDRPCGVGRFDTGETGVVAGGAHAAAQGVSLRFELKLAGSRILEARFQAIACPFTIACASCAAGWLPEHTVEEAYNLDMRQLVEALELPVERMYAPLIVEDALRAALKEV